MESLNVQFEGKYGLEEKELFNFVKSNVATPNDRIEDRLDKLEEKFSDLLTILTEKHTLNKDDLTLVLNCASDFRLVADTQ